LGSSYLSLNNSFDTSTYVAERAAYVAERVSNFLGMLTSFCLDFALSRAAFFEEKLIE
jgi:hypothetical protein